MSLDILEDEFYAVILLKGNSLALSYAGKKESCLKKIREKSLEYLDGREIYSFLYNKSSIAETLRTAGKYTSNPELGFTWHDCAIVSQKIRSGMLFTKLN